MVVLSVTEERPLRQSICVMHCGDYNLRRFFSSKHAFSAVSAPIFSKVCHTTYVGMYMYGMVILARSNRKVTVTSVLMKRRPYALLKRKVFSWRQKDVSVNDWSHSDVDKEFHVL